MPSPDAFLHAFQLSEGKILGSYRLDKIAITEETVSRYYHYRYNIDLTLVRAKIGSMTSTYHKLLSLLQQEPIAYGVRNPYRCSIEPLDDANITEQGNELHIHLIGHAKRTRV